MVAFEILRYVLALAVDGFMELFEDVGARAFGVDVVGLYVVEKDGEGLGAVAELGGAHGAFLRDFEHDAGGGETHLDAAEGVAVTVVLGEAEDAGEPDAGGG